MTLQCNFYVLAAKKAICPHCSELDASFETKGNIYICIAIQSLDENVK